MRTTINLDDDLLREAQRLTGVKERTALLREALHALIERESATPARSPRRQRARRSRRRRDDVYGPRDLGRHIGLDRAPAWHEPGPCDGVGRWPRAHAPVRAGRAGMRQPAQPSRTAGADAVVTRTADSRRLTPEP